MNDQRWQRLVELAGEQFGDDVPSTGPEWAVIVGEIASTDTAPNQSGDAERDVLAERRRQIEVEGWTPEHDDQHDPGELAAAGCAYALAASDMLYPLSQGDGGFDETPPSMWLWARSWWKPAEPRRMLVKAGALIIAEIERIDRIAAAPAAREAET